MLKNLVQKDDNIFINSKAYLKLRQTKVLKIVNYSRKGHNNAIGVIRISLLLTLNIFHTLPYCFYC